MPIPDFQALMLPVLGLAGDGAEHRIAEMRERIAADLRIPPAELAEKLKNGTSLFANRVAWAVTYLKKADALKSTGTGVYQITERGTSLLKLNLPKITLKVLNDSGNGGVPDGPLRAPRGDLTPEEQIDSSFQNLRDALADDILEALRNVQPSAFEQIVVDLLVAMGYGGSVQDAGAVVGGSGDGGIDGTIKQDKLGLDVVYVQAKRYQDNNPVGSPDLMKFCGSLTAHKASKGVMITTSYFTKDAVDFVKQIPHTIVLIDGLRLAELMVEYGVGVQPKKTYTIKRLDQDYFENL